MFSASILVHCGSKRTAGMASSPCGITNFDSGLEIKTRSVEQTLIPLVSQVSLVIQLRCNTLVCDGFCAVCRHSYVQLRRLAASWLFSLPKTTHQSLRDVQ